MSNECQGGNTGQKLTSGNPRNACPAQWFLGPELAGKGCHLRLPPWVSADVEKEEWIFRQKRGWFYLRTSPNSSVHHPGHSLARFWPQRCNLHVPRCTLFLLVLKDSLLSASVCRPEAYKWCTTASNWSCETSRIPLGFHLLSRFPGRFSAAVVTESRPVGREALGEGVLFNWRFSFCFCLVCFLVAHGF